MKQPEQPMQQKEDIKDNPTKITDSAVESTQTEAEKILLKYSQNPDNRYIR